LHKIFDSPNDKIIWDVGHQSYVHKLLTGRTENFHTLRSFGGLSGFTRREESTHDAFGSGHSSTSISAALGIARANAACNRKASYTIAVVGDGSFTGGLVYEALNNVEPSDKLIVILNDNEMSISKNKGRVADYLAKIRTNRRYYGAKHRVEKILRHIPLVGKHIILAMQKIKGALRRTIFHTTFFEHMGFDYLGPVDGNNISRLESVLNEAKQRDKPVFIYAKTHKGRGYTPAETESNLYHNVGTFDIDNGVDCKETPSFSKTCGKTLTNLAASNTKICAITASMCEGCALLDFSLAYPDRFFDVGIAESHAAVFAAGLAVGGLVPVFVVYSSFFQRAYDQIIHDIALQNLHVVLCIDRAGIVGEDGATHHGLFDIPFMNHIPNMTIYSPATYFELEQTLARAIGSMSSPVAVRYPKGEQNDIHSEIIDTKIEMGNGDYSYFGDETAECLFFSYGRISSLAFEVAGVLETENISCGIVKLNKIKPIDYQTVLDFVSAECKLIIFLEESIKSGGISESLCLNLMCRKTNVVYKIYAVDDEFIPHGSTDDIFAYCGFNIEKIYTDIKNELSTNLLNYGY
jgi:1-deoxy-D-xylulose-5-phosphate synthase